MCCNVDGFWKNCHWYPTSFSFHQHQDREEKPGQRTKQNQFCKNSLPFSPFGFHQLRSYTADSCSSCPQIPTGLPPSQPFLLSTCSSCPQIPTGLPPSQPFLLLPALPVPKFLLACHHLSLAHCLMTALPFPLERVQLLWGDQSTKKVNKKYTTWWIIRKTQHWRLNFFLISLCHKKRSQGQDNSVSST